MEIPNRSTGGKMRNAGQLVWLGTEQTLKSLIRKGSVDLDKELPLGEQGWAGF